MIKASEVVGRPVIVREGGHEAGRVRDLVVDQSGKQVLGLVVSEGMLRGTKVARWAAVTAVGPDSVVLGNFESVVNVNQAPEIKAIMDAGTNIRGLKLHTTSGKDLGRVEDFLFNEVTGAVEGYELSGGIFSDAFGGRSLLPTPPTIELGKDVAFVAPEVESTISQHSGGVKGAFTK